VFESVGCTRKTGLTVGLPRVGGENTGPSLPQKKIEFGIGGDTIFCCLKGLTCTFQSLLSRYSITCSVPHPSTLFLCKFGRITRPMINVGIDLKQLGSDVEMFEILHRD